MKDCPPGFACRLVLGLMLAYFCVAGSAVAQPAPEKPPDEMSLEQLMGTEVREVFGASKFLQRVTDAPSSVTIVTQQEIERFGYRTLADVLRGVRGFYVTNDRNYSYLGMRGFLRPGDYNSRVLVLIDGHRVNDNIYDSVLLGSEFPLDVALIDRIEVVRGPSSSLYGTNAFLGIVNIITRTAATMGAFSGDLELGSFDSRRARASAGITRGHLDAIFSATTFRSDGAETDGLRLDGERFSNAFARIGRGPLSLTSLYGTRRKRFGTGAYDTIRDDPSNYTVDARGFIDLRYENDWRGTSVQGRAYYDRYDYEGSYMYATDTGEPDPNGDTSSGQWWGAEGTLSRRAGRHLLTAGIEYRNNFQQDQWAADYLYDEVLLDDRRSSYLWALYGQDEVRLTRKVVLNAGVRHDHYSTFGSTTNPRLALIYKPAPNAALKLLHGTAFRAPNAYELYYFNRETLQPLDPETIRTSELAYEHYFAQAIRMSAGAFVFHVDGLITQERVSEDNDGMTYRNRDRARSMGVAIELEGDSGHVHWLGSYTWSHATDTAADVRLSNSPTHLVTGRATMPFVPGRVFAGVELHYLSARETLDATTVDPVVLVDLTVTSRRVARSLDLFVDVSNLFDRTYADPGSEEHPISAIQQDGRTFRARLAWHF